MKLTSIKFDSEGKACDQNGVRFRDEDQETLIAQVWWDNSQLIVEPTNGMTYLIDGSLEYEVKDGVAYLLPQPKPDREMSLSELTEAALKAHNEMPKEERMNNPFGDLKDFKFDPNEREDYPVETQEEIWNDWWAQLLNDPKSAMDNFTLTRKDK